MHEVAEGLAQVGVVREHQSHFAERQVASKDGIVADVPPERVNRIPDRIWESAKKHGSGRVGSGREES